MEPYPQGDKPMVLRLSWARGRLKALRKQELAGLEATREAVEEALEAVLQAEEHLWVAVREQRARLQGELVALQEANAEAAQEHKAQIQALQQRLTTLHTHLLSSPSAEMVQEVEELVACCAGLTLTLTWAHFVPETWELSLGELQKDERTLSLPSEKRGPKGVSKRPRSQEEGTRSQETGAFGKEGVQPTTEGTEKSGEDGESTVEKPTSPSAPEEVSEECLREDEDTDRSRKGTDASGTQETPSSPEPGTLFHARPVWLQEDSSEASSGLCREAIVRGSRVPSAKGLPSFCRWASAECLGRPGSGGPAKGLGDSRMELVETGSKVSLQAKTPEWPPWALNPALCPQNLPQSPPMPSPLCDRLVGQWGSRGSRKGQLCLPYGLCVVPTAGTFFVVDFGNRRLHELGGGGRTLTLKGKSYFDVAPDGEGNLAITNITQHCVELYSPEGRLLQIFSEGLQGPRGIAVSPKGKLLVADTHLGVLHVLGTSSLRQLTRHGTVPGFHKPYLVATNSRGQVAVSERGLEGGCCVKVLGPTWWVLRVLGVPDSPPLLTDPWGVSLDNTGRVLVADWGHRDHRVLCFPRKGQGWAVVNKDLSSPRGVALLGEHHLVVADSMHHCLKVFQYC